MRKQEFKCVNLLTELVENEGVIGIKVSFEDEGASYEEVMRLKEICNQAKTKLTLKIGGPEDKRSMIDSTTIGVKGIVGPMVESAFGLQKFIKAANSVIPKDVVSSLNLYVNVETITGADNIESMINTEEFKQLHGVTIGRVDLVGSLGKDRTYVNSDFIYETSKKVFKKVKEAGLKACLGGAISVDSEKFISKLYSEGLLDKFETRYVIFDPSISLKNLSRSLAKAQLFEYEWLKCKRENYLSQANKELDRIEMIQSRINKSISF
jgi:4-hydroxy-2-oxoheptanedioate aldolase